MTIQPNHSNHRYQNYNWKSQNMSPLQQKLVCFQIKTLKTRRQKLIFKSTIHNSFKSKAIQSKSHLKRSKKRKKKN